MTIETQCLDYFKSVNPLTQKICEDIEKIIAKNSEKWDSLDVKVKEKILDQSFIDESLVKKYEAQSQDYEEDYSDLSTFSWFTKSQLNLFSHIKVKPDKSRTPMKKTEILSPLKKTKAPAPPAKTTEAATKQMKVEKPEKVCPKKPKTPPPPPPARLVPAEKKGLLEKAQQPHGDDIPKTGFDFLDNW